MNSSVSIPLSHSSPSILLEKSEDQQTTVFQNSINMNNQAFSFPVNNTISSLKLPSFWISCQETWFIQTEMQFDIKQIVDDTIKYQNVIVALPQEVITKILDILHNPPITNKYEFIKRVLCERFSLRKKRD